MRPPLPFSKPAMPKTCSTCIHWHLQRPTARTDGPVGECREGSPTRDFAWPRTKGCDYCSRYATTQAEARAETARAERERIPAAPSAPAPAPAEAQQLSLDATPESGAATPPGSPVGKTKQPGSVSGNRPRRDPARTAESGGQASAAGVE